MQNKMWLIPLAIVAGGLVLVLWPQRLTFYRIRMALERDGMNVANVEQIRQPAHGAIEEYRMTVGGSLVQVFEFRDRQKLEECHNLYRDPVKARQTLNSLGISPTAAGPTLVRRNGWFVLTITSHNEVLRNRVIYLFSKL